jgi:hypothetical protein
MNSNLRRRLKAIADDLRGPLGRIPLDRVLRRHLDLFEELRREGCTWLQLARALALAAAGVRRADGKMVSVDHLRGTVSRQTREKNLRATSPAKERSRAAANRGLGGPNAAYIANRRGSQAQRAENDLKIARGCT